MKLTFAVALLLATAPFVTAAAQSAFGDTQRSYFDGVVFDDDLVPGRGPNQPFLVQEREAGGTAQRRIRQPLQDRIVPQGRIGEVVRRNDPRFSNVRIQP